MEKNMKMKTLLAALLILGAVAPCWAGKAKTRARSRPDFDFADYPTYAWTKGTPAVYPGVQEIILAAVESELAKRGVTRTEVADAALLVSTYTFAQGEMDVIGRSFWGAYGGMIRTDISEFKKGVLYIKIVQPGSDEPMWQGLAGKAVNGDPEKVMEKLPAIVSRIFETQPELIEPSGDTPD
jgi:hypothetical protein